MGIFDNFLDRMKLSEDYDEDESELYDDDDDDKEEISSKKYSSRSKSDDIFEEDLNETPRRTQSKPVKASKPVRQSQRTSANGNQNKVISMQRNSNSLEVCVIKPTNVEDGREISDTLLSGRAVVLNLEGIDVELAQRIIDFTSGACYSIKGNLQKISNYIFIVTPNNIDISGDFQQFLDGGDFKFNSGASF